VIIFDALAASESTGLNPGFVSISESHISFPILTQRLSLAGMFFIISLLSLGFQSLALFLTQHRIHLESPVPHLSLILRRLHPLLTLSWRQLAGVVVGLMLMVQALLFLAIIISLFNHSFAKSIIRTSRVIPLLAVLFDGLGCLAGVALCIVAMKL
jgi:hypothetical protein